ncbi:MAG: glycerophosphodiester phosphodiesterase family protein [Bacilli bacterium]|nr:glycerophosphodiester phosphodiesterase family protein [Bacilli bacterium]
MQHNEFLWQEIQKKGFLIAAHRGTNGGNIIQNTTLAYKNSLLHGADIIELDVIMSTDEEFFAFHNGQESMVLHQNFDIREKSSQELLQYPCYNDNDHAAAQRLERVGDILKAFKGKCFINIDRSWFYWQKTISFLSSFDMNDQIILKSPVQPALLQTLQDSHSSIMYMPIITSYEQLEVVQSYDINFVAAELIFSDTNSVLQSSQLLHDLYQKRIATWVNAITLHDDATLCGNFDDNISIREDFSKGWGELADRGFTLIQTDWPALLDRYRTSRI